VITIGAERGMTLIEVLLAVALTALLGITLATSLNLWFGAKERMANSDPVASRVLSLCDGLERRFDALVLRRLHEHRLPVHAQPLNWRADEQRLDWVALDGMPVPGGSQAGRLRRQSLVWDRESQRLGVASSGDLDAVAEPGWSAAMTLDGVDALMVEFFDGQRWLAYPSEPVVKGTAGVRLTLQVHGEPFVCTFVLPDTV
jgi:general secretion pathway protein J